MVTSIRTVGRRKTSVAVVTLTDGTGAVSINGRPAREFFGHSPDKLEAALSPLALTKLGDKFDLQVLVRGGGVTGQGDAIKMAVARALTVYNKELRPVLKKQSMLRRDSRMVERKKSGQPKARKKFQWTKR
jgi:small subunit ribosomal protein S9